MSKNGETSVDSTEGMDLEGKVDLIVQAITDQAELLDQIREQQEEIIERLTNLSLPGGDFDIYDDEN